jgi:hypothetical protein
MDTSIQVAAIVVIASFVIDRVAGGVFFLLSLVDAWNEWVPDPAARQDAGDKLAAQKRQKLIYYSFVAILALSIVFAFNLRVLGALHVTENPPNVWLDQLFSVLVLMGGSDQIAALLKSPHAGKAVETTSTAKPIEVTGRLTLDESAARATHAARSTGERSAP